jgi:hypothetical protein
MPRASSPLEQQLARARRRLFVQSLIENLVVAWLAVFIVAGFWYLVQPWILTQAPMAGRETVLWVLLGLGTLVGIVRTMLMRPSPVRAALEVDARFGLKERVVTGATLSAEDAASPAGQALLADANSRLQPLRMSDQFPVKLPATTWFVPVGLLVVVLLLLLYRPQPAQVAASEDKPLSLDERQKAMLDESKKDLMRKKEQEKPRDKISQQLEKIRDQGDQIARRNVDTREQARDALKEIGDAEEQIQKRQKELAQKQEAFQKQMEQVQKAAEKQDPERLKKKSQKDNPARDLDKAVKQGDFGQGRDEADRLFRQLDPDEARQRAQREADIQKELDRADLPEEQKQKLQRELQDLAAQKLTEEERQQLKDALKDLAKDLKAAADADEKRDKELAKQQKELENKLAQAKNEEEKQQIQKQLDDVKQQRDQGLGEQGRQEARDLAKKLEEAKNALDKGDDAEAARKLQEAANQMAKMDAGEERDELGKQKGKLDQARKALCLALEGKQGNQPGNQQGNQPGQGKNAPGGPGGPATGARPDGKPHETTQKEERSRSQLGKGKQSILDFVPGEGLKEPFNPGAHGDVIRQAAQEAPEALDRQQLPRGASDMVRGYFDKFRGADKNAPPKK